MNGASIALGAALAAVVGLAAWRTVKKLKKGGGCCGEHEETVKRARPSMKGEKMDHAVELTIGGMTCENCARRVENALNGVEGVRARVRLDTHTARVRCAGEPNEAALKEAVRKAGYVVTGSRTV